MFIDSTDSRPRQRSPSATSEEQDRDRTSRSTSPASVAGSVAGRYASLVCSSRKQAFSMDGWIAQQQSSFFVVGASLVRMLVTKTAICPMPKTSLIGLSGSELAECFL